MDELFNILSSSARINKSKRKKPKVATPSPSSLLTSIPNLPSIAPPSKDDDNDDNSTELTKNKKNHSIEKQHQIHRETIAAFRNKLSIHLSSSNRHDPSVPDPISSFHELLPPSWWINNNDSNSNSNNNSSNNNNGENSQFNSLKTTLIKNIEQGRWINPTPIQMQSIPSLLGRRDTLGCAPTGSGKSGAFIVPSLFLCSVNDSTFYGTHSTNQTENNNKTEKKDKTKNGSNKRKNNETKNDDQKGKIRALLLAPSRELASQLHREVQRLGEGKVGGLKCTLLSKSNVNTVAAGKKGCDVLVSTPLRLVECLEGDHADKLDLGSVRIVVLDEADRLLDASDGATSHSYNHSQTNSVEKTEEEESEESSSDESSTSGDSHSKSSNDEDHDSGNNHNTKNEHQQQNQSGSAHAKTFLSQIDTILSNIPTTAVRALFSATIGPSVRHLSESILRNPIDITVSPHYNKHNQKSNNGSGNAATGVSQTITQKLQFVGKEEGKLLAIRQIIQAGITPPVIIFLQSKDRAQALYRELLYDKIRVDVIHAGKSQSARDDAVAKFRKGESWVLICTDLVARGVDFKAVNMVINYDLPTSGVTYVHRIGRCGRAGREGVAITLFTEADFDHLRTIANVVKLSGCHVPDWMLSLKKSSGKGGSGKKGVVKRKDIDTTAGYDKVKRYKRKQYIENSLKNKKKKLGQEKKR